MKEQKKDDSSIKAIKRCRAMSGTPQIQKSSEKERKCFLI